MLRELHEITKDTSARFIPPSEKPVPFREWMGTERVKLPVREDPDTPAYGMFFPLPDGPEFSLENIAKFLELGAGITAVYGGDLYKSVRVNPSAGNLHPEEVYVILPQEGIFHYGVKEHSLYLRAGFPRELSEGLRSLLPDGGFFVAATAIYWRSVWKYGIRGFRYSLLDVGHLLGSLRASARLLGWDLVPVWNVSPDTLDVVLGFTDVDFPKGEEEYPQLLMAVIPLGGSYPSCIPKDIVEMFRGLDFKGEPNRLSPDLSGPVTFPEIEALERETRKGYWEGFELLKSQVEVPTRKSDFPENVRGADVIRKRRSPFAFKGDSFLSGEVFERIVRLIHNTKDDGIMFKVFTQRVTGLEDGVYDPYINPLKLGKVRRFLVKLTCNQKHVGDANLNFPILADMSLAYEVPKLYRTIHYRGGALAQNIYLLAEMFGLQANAIGCFNDDLLEVYSITDLTYVHHISVGFGNMPQSWRPVPFRYQ